MSTDTGPWVDSDLLLSDLYGMDEDRTWVNHVRKRAREQGLKLVRLRRSDDWIERWYSDKGNGIWYPFVLVRTTGRWRGHVFSDFETFDMLGTKQSYRGGGLLVTDMDCGVNLLWYYEVLHSQFCTCGGGLVITDVNTCDPELARKFAYTQVWVEDEDDES